MAATESTEQNCCEELTSTFYDPKLDYTCDSGKCFARLRESAELPYRAIVGLVLLVVFIPVVVLEGDYVAGGINKQNDWWLLFWYGFILIMTAQVSYYAAQFFAGGGSTVFGVIRYYLFGHSLADSAPEAISAESVTFWRLMPSAFISWIFAKSIRNASNLAYKYGQLGGWAYAGWYTSFWSAAGVCYMLRTRNKASSLPGAIERCYGGVGQVLFCLGVLYRLTNEVWSNSLVVASFYGDYHSGPWWIAIVFSTLIPAVYVLVGGMRSSLISDVVQAALAVVFLFIVLGNLSNLGNALNYTPQGGWPAGGGELLAVALIQGIYSYPFHDPVLTDRCFLGTPKVMLQSFIVGGLVSALFIVFFSWIGLVAAYEGVASNGAADASLAATISASLFTFVNFIMMTSSMSTLDSTFTSTSRLLALDMGGWLRVDGDQDTRAVRGPIQNADIPEHASTRHIWIGRVVIVLLAIFGTLPLLEQSNALNATTLSGTTVMGLGPPIYLMIFWKFGDKDGWFQSPNAFLFSFFTGIVYGGLYQSKDMPASVLSWGVTFGQGSYSALLGANVWGHLMCTAACAIGFGLDQCVQQTKRVTLPDSEANISVGDVAMSKVKSVSMDGGGKALVDEPVEVEVEATSPSADL